MLLLGDRQIQQRRTGHFCRPPYVAAGFGPSHPLAGRSLEEGWRMVSEDTENSGWLHLAICVDGATETAFSVYKTHNPSHEFESFLLIFRRGPCQAARHWIVTAAHVTQLTKGV